MRASTALLLVGLVLIGGTLAVRAIVEPSTAATLDHDEPPARPGSADRVDPAGAVGERTGSDPEPGAVSAPELQPARAEDVGEGHAAADAAGIPSSPVTPRSRREALTRDWIEERSLRFANELALAAGAERRIAEILLETDRRMEPVRREARALGGTDSERVRAAAAEVRAWRDAAFEREFGAELGPRIVELEQAPVVLGDGADAASSPQGEAGESPRD